MTKAGYDATHGVPAVAAQTCSRNSNVPPPSSEAPEQRPRVDPNKLKSAKQSSAAGIQPRGRALLQSIPEHKEVVERHVPWAVAKTWLEPRGQRTKRVYKFGSVTNGRDWKVLEVQSGATGGYLGQDCVVVKFGIPWSVSEFFAKAQSLDHLFQCDEVDDEVTTAIFRILTMGPDWVAMKRAKWLKRWTAIAKELEEEEEVLLSSVHPEVAPFSRPKRPLVFYKMLLEAGFPRLAAKQCLNLLLRGVPMFGPFPPTGVFPSRRHAATTTVEELSKTGSNARRSLLTSMRPSGSKSCDESVYKKTLQARDAGICGGPFDEAHFNKKFGDGWLIARRFGVPQKGDFRAVDDFSEHGQNSTSDTWETVDTDGVDAIVAVAKLWVSAVEPNGRVIVRLSSGVVLQAWLHPAFAEAHAQELLARLVDLVKAHNQLAKDPTQSALSVIAAWNPHQNCTELFNPYGCGFGPRNVVFGFNLFARALKWLLSTQLLIPVTHFSTTSRT